MKTDSGKNWVELFLNGSSSLSHETLYDPVKAREYYLRTRELRGRQSSSKLKTTDKKERWAYTKSQIKKNSRSESDEIKNTRVAEIAALRQTAKTNRERLTDKMSTILKQLSDSKAEASKLLSDAKSDKLAEIKSDAQKAIERLPKIPNGISPKRREQLLVERQEKIAAINGKAKLESDKVIADTTSDKTKLAESITDDKTKEKSLVSEERVRIAETLKTSIDSAKSNYEKLKTDIKAKYDPIYQSEYDKIKAG